MTNMSVHVIPGQATKASALRYLSCLRPQDILVLQGSPLLGAAFAIRNHGLHDLVPLATLLIANVFLVTHIFLLNDWSGMATDLADPNKAAHVFTARGVGRTEMGRLAAGLLIASLLLFSVLGPVTLGLSLAIATLSALYSLPRFNWKGRPLLNSTAHLAGGILHFLLGYSIGSAIDPRGIAIATFFALIFAAGHLTQEIRDYEGDAINGIRTNAVTFGRRRTFVASLILFTLAHMLLLVLAFQGLLPRALAILAVLFALQLYWSFETFHQGLTYASVSRLQTRYRVLYAVVGVTMVVALVWAGGGNPSAAYRGTLPAMALPQSKVTAQGQISVPAEIRRKLGIGPGAVLEWEEDGERVIVRRAGRYTFEDIHHAVFPRKPRPRKLKELKQAIGRHIRARHARD